MEEADQKGIAPFITEIRTIGGIHLKPNILNYAIDINFGVEPRFILMTGKRWLFEGDHDMASGFFTYLKAQSFPEKHSERITILLKASSVGYRAIGGAFPQ